MEWVLVVVGATYMLFETLWGRTSIHEFCGDTFPSTVFHTFLAIIPSPIIGKENGILMIVLDGSAEVKRIWGSQPKSIW